MLRYLFLISFTINILYANIIIKNNTDIFDEIPTQIFEDTNANLSIEEVQKINIFKPYSNNISQGYSSSAFWIKFNVNNKTTNNLEYYIHFTEVYQDKIDCYIISDDKSYLKQKAGAGYFTKGKKNNVKKPTFNLNIESNQSKTIYLRITSKYPHFTSFQIMKKDNLNNIMHKFDLMHTFFFGAIFTLMLYNLVIFFYTRDISYIYYVLFGLSFATWQLMMSASFPLNSFNSSHSFYSLASSIPLTLAFLLLFSREILETKKLFRKIDTILKIGVIIYFTLTVGSIFIMEILTPVMNTITIIFLPFLLFVGFKSYFAGNKTAIIFIIAQISFLSLSILFSLSAQGFLDYSFINRYGILLGSIMEIILFSLALSYKIRLLEEEKISLISQANQELDKKVKERTKELEESKKSLEALAHTDALTGLENRRSLFNSAKLLLPIAQRKKEAISLLLFDIDKFKSINDNYGHNTGDNVIIEFSNLLKMSRESDMSVRYGGEEFILLLPNTTKDDASHIAQTLKDEVHQLHMLSTDQQEFHFTVSCGVSTYDFENDKNLDDLIARADKALYISKNSGRDKVSVL